MNHRSCAIGRLCDTSAVESAEHVFQAAPNAVEVPSTALDEAEFALSVLRQSSGFAATPLRELALAQALDIDCVLYKDESPRFGLNSFKGMGVVYALLGEMARIYGLAELPDFPTVRRILARELSKPTIACATDGNHGRAVAWAASLLAIPCIIFLPTAVSDARAAAIVALGAQTRRVAGNYDDAVRAAAEAASRHGWRIISDTAYDNYEDVPRDIMRGYSAIGAEIHEQCPNFTPTHVFAQAGVGGFAASMFTYFAALTPKCPPVNVVVEPLRAACLFASARAGRRTVVEGTLDTVMAGLACGEPSTLAWELIAARNCHFLAISDNSTAAAMHLLAEPAVVDPPIIAGESGAAGLAGLLCAVMRPDLRAALAIDAGSRVLLIGTEGATDPLSYQRMMESASLADECRESVA